MIKQIYKEGKGLFKDIYLSRLVIYELTRREFKIMYGNKYLGLLWALLEPVAMMLILVLVFTYLRGGRSADGFPFAIYLLSGIIGFNFF